MKMQMATNAVHYQFGAEGLIL